MTIAIETYPSPIVLAIVLTVEPLPRTIRENDCENDCD